MSDAEGVEGYDPDEVLLDRTDNQTKEFANRLHEVFAGDRLDPRAPMVRILLVDRFEEQVREYVIGYRTGGKREQRRANGKSVRSTAFCRTRPMSTVEELRRQRSQVQIQQ